MKQHGKKALLDLRKAACSFLPVRSLSRRQACHSKLPGSIKEVGMSSMDNYFNEREIH